MQYFFHIEEFHEGQNKILLEHFGVVFSMHFKNIAQKKLYEYFVDTFKFKPNPKILCLSPSLHTAPVYSVDKSYFKTTLVANHNFHTVTVAWFSKKGIVYTIDAEDIDEDDIVFYVEGIDTTTIMRNLYPKEKLPFTTKKFSFQVEVVRLNMNMSIVLHGSTKEAIQLANFYQKFDEFMYAYYKKDNAIGNVHSHQFLEENNIVTISIDMGSSGFTMLKKILAYLSTTNLFTKVVIE